MTGNFLTPRLTTQAKKIIRHPAVQGVWRQVAAHRQRLDYQALLRELGSAAPYSETLVRHRLMEKAAQRQPLCGSDGKPHVVGFGAEDWENLGFWQAFAAQSHFRFVDLRALRQRHATHRRDAAARRRTSELCLAECDALRAVAPVTLAFFYTDTDAFMPRLLCEGLAERGIWSVVLGLDDKHRFVPRRERGGVVGQSTLLPHVDLLWTNWPSLACVANQRGGTAWFAPQAADGQVHRPQAERRDIDVLFFGQNYGYRGRLVQELREQGIRVHTAGRGWPEGFVSFDKSLELIGRAKIVLGYGGTGAMSRICCLKGRDFEVPMCGAVYLTSYNAELAAHYRIGDEILCYSTPTECAEIIHSLLKDPTKQALLRKNGRRRALKEHTWNARIASLFALFARAS